MSELERYGVAALAVTIILVLLVSLGGLASSTELQARRIPLPNATTPMAKSAAPEEPLVVAADLGSKGNVPTSSVAFAEEVRTQPELGPPATGTDKAVPATVFEANANANASTTHAGEKSVSAIKYLVQHGDTLGAIAQSRLGSSRRWSEIVAINKGLTATTLKAGREIVLPQGNAAKTTVAAPAAPVAATAAAASPEHVKRLERTAEAVKIYTVKKDDTLESIAEKQLGDRKRWRELYDLNRKRLKKPDCLFAGVKLQIPR